MITPQYGTVSLPHCRHVLELSYEKQRREETDRLNSRVHYKQLSELKQEADSTKLLIHRLEDQNSQLRAQMKSKIQHKDQLCQELEADCELAQMRNKELEHTLREATEQIEKLRTALQQKSVDSSSEAELIKLKGELASSVSKCQELEHINRSRIHEHNSSQNELRTLQNELRRVKEDAFKLTSQLREKEIQERSAAQSRDSLQKELRGLKEENFKLSAIVRDKELKERSSLQSAESLQIELRQVDIGLLTTLTAPSSDLWPIYPDFGSA